MGSNSSITACNSAKSALSLSGALASSGSISCLIAGGIGYQISRRTEGIELVDQETSTVDAELIENEPKEAVD